MEQINNYAMLHMLQELTKGPASAPKKDSQTDGSSFEKLMEEHRQSVKQDDGQKKPEAEAAEKAETAETDREVPVQGQDEETWRNQMALAAMVVLLRVPVVAVEVQDQQAVPVEMAVTQQLTVTPETVVQQAAEPVEQQPQAENMLPVEDDSPKTGVAETKTPVEEPAQREHVSADKAPVQTTSQQKDEVKVTEVSQEPSLFGEVKAVPVKVGETNAAMQSGQPEHVEKQLMKPLTEALQRGESRVEIQLTPASLGNVKVEITRHADGSLHVLLNAENPHTQTLLDKHASNLQSALLTQSQEPVRVVVHQQESQQQNTDYQQNEQQNGHQQEQHQQRQSKQNEQDFLQQLRLGLVSLDPA